MTKLFCCWFTLTLYCNIFVNNKNIFNTSVREVDTSNVNMLLNNLCALCPWYSVVSRMHLRFKCPLRLKNIVIQRNLALYLTWQKFYNSKVCAHFQKFSIYIVCDALWCQETRFIAALIGLQFSVVLQILCCLGKQKSILNAYNVI